jgi:hypothetical protein
VTLCALWFVPQIQLRLDGRSLIPAGLPEFAEGDRAAARFGLRDHVVIGVGNEESGVYTPETLARVGRLSEGLSLVEGVVAGSVVSLTTLPRAAFADGKLETRPLLQRGVEPTAEEIPRLRREVVRAGRSTGTLVSADGRARGAATRSTSAGRR